MPLGQTVTLWAVKGRSVRLSVAEARRVALAAQGFADAQPRRPDRRHVHRVLDRVGVVQIDSVNIVARNHDLPLFARLGSHRRDSLVAASHRGEVFEYWAHEASFVPVALHPLLRHRMAAAAEGSAWSGLVRLARERPRFIEDVHAEVADRGPISAGELSQGGGRTGPWWGWNDGKRALEWLFWCGRLAARRRPSFEREYALPEQVIPSAVLALPTPEPDEAQRSLLLVAARCLGVATAEDLADYFRLRMPVARGRLAELVEDGRLEPVEVEGWRRPAYLLPGTPVPRRVRAATLLSPFDSLVWCRERTERLFGFHYRLEFYTPAPRRRFGYYVMPFLLGEQLPARVDLKADRQAGVLRVLGSFAEAGPVDPPTVPALAEALARLAAFLGLERVGVEPRGDLAAALGAAVVAHGASGGPAVA